MPIGIAYVDGPRLARSLYAAADWVEAGRAELNRLNVFPVPDGDTGTNFSLTLRAVAEAVRAAGDGTLGATAAAAARGAVLGARGNSGMMLAQFLLGFSASLGDRVSAGAATIAAALGTGADTLYASLDEPREGTILTVARETAAAAERAARGASDLAPFLHQVLAEAEVALARTPELLAVLKEAGVVDAGGKAFVRMLEGVVRLVDGEAVLAPPRPGPTSESSPAAEAMVAADRDYQFCTECLVRGSSLPSANEVRRALHQLGGSVVVATIGDILKLHVHTDTPEKVFSLAEGWGTIAQRKADDMRAQHRALGHPERRPVAIVADSSADLPDSILDRHRIALIPLQVTFDDTTYADRVELSPADFYRRLRASPTLPTTSQPSPGEFVRAFRSAAGEADEVVAVLLSSVLSGTFQAASAAVKAAGLGRVYLCDSRSASLGLGLLALRAAELAESGWRAAAIVNELHRVRAQSGMFLTVATYDNLLRSGRVSRGKAWLAGMLDVKPILSLDGEGRVVATDRARGGDQVLARILARLAGLLSAGPRAVRFGVAHADAPDTAAKVRDALVARFQPRDCLVSLATGVLATHTGPGAWAVFYQIEDGTPTHPARVDG
jgi:DegV family protein with EDD domain